MTFPEKSAIATIVALVLAYGGYAVVVGAQLSGGDDVRDVSYKALLVLATVVLAVAMSVSHGVIAAISPKAAAAFDERDRMISWRAERLGGLALTVGVSGTLLLTLLEVSYFWIANTLMLGWVLSELVAQASALVLYRRAS